MPAPARARAGSAADRGARVPAVPIDSADDPRVQDYRAVREPELVRRRGLFIAEGELVLRRALRAGYSPRSLLVDAKRIDQIADVPVGVAGG